MKISKFILYFAFIWLPISGFATIAPTATYVNEEGNEVTVSDKVSGDAPLLVRFTANASDLDAGSSLEWHIVHQGERLTRYEENPEYTFTEAGITDVTLYVRLDNELVDSATIEVTVTESHLEMPNAFSPNGDYTNEIYGAKGVNDPSSKGRYRSIVEFHAYIFNRWGQKLFEWTDISKGWDGTYKGSPVKEGVYFVFVKARGSDGKVYEIRKDVNLIRRFNQETTGGSDE